MSYRILILASAAVFGVCDGPADDDPLATCDRIAEKYVAAFAAKDVEGPAREKALDKCVLGPEQDYTDAGRTWVACMESAASPAQMVKCQRNSRRLWSTKSCRRSEAMTLAAKAMVCDGMTKEDATIALQIVDSAAASAKTAGASDEQIETAKNVMGGRDAEQLKTELCK
jgi:hypothetical protein